MERNPLIPLFLFIIILISPITIARAQFSFTLTVTTSKQYYYLGEIVEIYGNLTLDDAPVQNALVGLEVTDSKKSIIIRTLPTSPEPQQNWLIEVLSVIPCDENGNPKNSFSRGGLSFFNITIRNNDIEVRSVLITINIYDSSNAPIGLSTISGYISDNSTATVILSIAIPKTATLGTAQAYANVHSAAPKFGGKPYGPEKSGQFQIISSYVSKTTANLQNLKTLTINTNYTLNGNYTTTFKLPPTISAGTFKVYVSSMYLGYTALNYTTFYVKVPGDVNGDFKVDGIDLALLGAAWWASPIDPNWNPDCDFDQSGRVDGGDLALLGSYWGYKF